MDFRDVGARREKGDVGVGKIVIVEHLHFEDFRVAIAHLHAYGIARGDGDHLDDGKFALGKDFEDFAAHIPSGADHGDFIAHAHAFAFLQISLLVISRSAAAGLRDQFTYFGTSLRIGSDRVAISCVCWS